MSASPNYVGTPKSYAVALSTASDNRSTPTNPAILCNPGAAAINIPAINIKARGTTTADVVMFFLYDGASHFLVHEETVSAVANPSVAAGTKTFETTYIPDLPISIPVGWQLRVATAIGQSYAVSAFSGGEY